MKWTDFLEIWYLSKFHDYNMSDIVNFARSAWTFFLKSFHFNDIFLFLRYEILVNSIRLLGLLNQVFKDAEILVNSSRCHLDIHLISFDQERIDKCWNFLQLEYLVWNCHAAVWGGTMLIGEYIGEYWGRFLPTLQKFVDFCISSFLIFFRGTTIVSFWNEQIFGVTDPKECWGLKKIIKNRDIPFWGVFLNS